MQFVYRFSLISEVVCAKQKKSDFCLKFSVPPTPINCYLDFVLLLLSSAAFANPRYKTQSTASQRSQPVSKRIRIDRSAVCVYVYLLRFSSSWYFVLSLRVHWIVPFFCCCSIKPQVFNDH